METKETNEMTTKGTEKHVISDREEWLVTKSVLCDSLAAMDLAQDHSDWVLDEQEKDDIKHCLRLLNEFLNAYIPAQ